MLNFFDVRDGGRLVDLPGYGYAKATRGAQAAWQQSVNSYLSYRDCLVGVILVMDIRHPFQPFDDQLLEWSAASELPLHILLNKADKLKSGARSKALLQAKKRLANVAGVSVQLLFRAHGVWAGRGAGGDSRIARAFKDRTESRLGRELPASLSVKAAGSLD